MGTLKIIRSNVSDVCGHAVLAVRHIYNNIYENVTTNMSERFSGSRLAGHIAGHKKEKSENEILIDNIIEARSELERAELAFNELTDNAAIDYAAYSIMAARARYVHLLNIAKENNVKF